MKIYLASKSPRRQELLTMMGVDFDLLLIDAPEWVAPNETPEQYSIRITEEKLKAAAAKMSHDHLPIRPILCADTEVVLDEKILGKPENHATAFNMIKNYSGRTHRVITSIGVVYRDYQKVVMNTTLVTFASMSDEDILRYLARGDYQDKAGAYGIQNYIGQFISRIEGCFYSVIGLPLNSVREILNDLVTKYA